MKTTTWRSLLALWVGIVPLNVFAKDFVKPAKCGTFDFSGVFAKSPKALVFKMYEGTRSEIQFSLDATLTRVAGAYEGQPVTFEAKLESPAKKQRGALAVSESLPAGRDLLPLLKLTKIRLRVPDPLDPAHDSQMRLLKEQPCSN